MPIDPNFMKKPAAGEHKGHAVRGVVKPPKKLGVHGTNVAVDHDSCNGDGICLSAVTLVRALHPPLKYGAFLSSYGWGGGALRQAQEMLASTGIEMAGAVEINGLTGKDTDKKIAEIGKALAAKIKG